MQSSSPQRSRGHIMKVDDTYGFAKTYRKVFFHVSDVRGNLKKLSPELVGKQVELTIVHSKDGRLPKAVDIEIIDPSAA